MIFEDLGINRELLTTIKQLGIEKPTQIQELSIPHIIKKRDVIGESATGSGKTLAFGCGIVEQVKPKEGLQALILTPTRELAEQVKNSLKSLSKNLRVAPIYGGISINPQIQELQRAEVVVATPGRLLDHLKRRTINLSRIKVLVLDEADRMFDMGFIYDVEKIIRACPQKRQTLFFSATISPRVGELARKHMVNPEKVKAINQVDPSKLKQEYYNVEKNMKLSLFVHLLQEEKESGLVMVFCNTRRNVDFVAKNLKGNGLKATSIHGGLSQNRRITVINQFNDAKLGVLVCTDVAARGLHIENVSHIYNYDIPKDAKDYVHRIGRTARAGEKGKAVNLLCEYDYNNFAQIQRDYSSFNIKKMEVPRLKRIKTLVSIRNPRESRRSEFRREGPIARFGNRRRFFKGGGQGRSDERSSSRFGNREGPSRFGNRGQGSRFSREGRSNSGFGDRPRFGNRQSSRPKWNNSDRD